LSADEDSIEGLLGLQRKLKDGLIEHYDYEAVSLEIWRFLKNWFGTDGRVERQIQFDVESECLFLDLYPKKTLLM